MATTLNDTGIVFPDGTIIRSDTGRYVTNSNIQIEGAVIGGTGYTCWSSTNAAINGRGKMYNSMYTSAITFDGKSYSLGTGSFVSTLKKTIVNASGNTLRINIISGLYDWTDDTTRWVVYENGSSTNTYTHSGGTLVYDSGSAARTGSWYSSVTLATGTVTRDIPSGSTYTYTMYGGVMSGSNTDGVSPYFNITLNSWV